MLEEVVEECAGFGRVGAGACGAANLGSGQRSADSCDGIVVELEVLRGRAVPVADVGFIPDFEVPGIDFFPAVARDQMLGKSADELAPHLIVFWRVV